jgi:hypothetical protein
MSRTMTAPARFVIELCCKPGIDSTRALRRGLKFLGRTCGLRAVSVTEIAPDGAALDHERDRLLQELTTAPPSEAPGILARNGKYLRGLPSSEREALLAACEDLLHDRSDTQDDSE